MKNANPTPPAARLWMTGSLAVVMLASLPTRTLAGDERARASKVSRHSPYGVQETVRRIEDAARGAGLSVLVRLEGSRPVIVLASSVGGTPVVMQASDAQPDMPLALQVCASAGGACEVLMAASADAADSDWTELPATVGDDLAQLPGMLDRALA
jgi:uncharacterized protein (DUF302 family)